MGITAYREEAIADHELEEYKNTLKVYWRSSNQV